MEGRKEGERGDREGQKHDFNCKGEENGVNLGRRREGRCR